MKNMILGVASGIILILLLLCLYTVQGDATRSRESSESIAQAMENAVAKMAKEENGYQSNEEFRAAFIENLLAQIDSKSDVKVKILMSDYEKGLIQAEVTEDYTTPRGDAKSVACMRTILLENYKK